MTLRKRTNELKNGESVKISRINEGTYTTVEVSGNGLILRFVRHTPAGFKVFKKIDRNLL